MAYTTLVILAIIGSLVPSVMGHGRMIEPPQRSSMFRAFPGQGFEPNYNDNELFCGGFQRQWEQNGGKCGTCGDPYDGERKNEAGGIYATGFIGRRYQKGQDIDVEIQLTANHLGYMQFKICPHNDVTTQVSQECLDKHLLEIAGQPGVTKYEPGSLVGSHFLKLALPADMTCEQCILQWHYVAGNNHNCDLITGECCKGCGPQETFINCADIAIDGDGDDSINPTTKAPTTSQVPTTIKVTSSSTTTSVKPSTQSPTMAPTTSTAAPPATSSNPGNHNPTCAADERLDCIGVGVYDGLGYEGWCEIHCGVNAPACTADLCSCRCVSARNCYAIGVFDTIPGMDDYCQQNCQDGCPDLSHICKCDD